MSFKKYAQQLMAMNPQIVPRHGTPLNRRDLLAQGFITATATTAVPSIFSLLSSEAHAQGNAACDAGAGAQKSTMMPVLIVDCAGGSNLAGKNIIVGGRGGQKDFLPAGSYKTLGLAAEAEPGRQGVTLENFGGSLWHPTSGVLAGIRAALDPLAYDNIGVTTVCSRLGDDTQNNLTSPMYWIGRVGAKGELVNFVGSNDSISGGNSMADPTSVDLAQKPIVIRSAQDVLSIIQPGRLAELVGDENVKKIIEVARKMSASELARFQGRSVPDQLKTIVDCSHHNALKQISGYTPAMLDWTQDPEMTGIFNVNNGLQRTTGSQVSLLLKRYAMVGCVTQGGCDYHGNSQTVTTARDVETGDIIGRTLQAAYVKKIPIMIIRYSDGGVAAGDQQDANQPGTYNWAGDSGTRHLAAVFVYHPDKKTADIIQDPEKVQLGCYSSEGSVVTDPAQGGTLVSDSASNLAKFFAFTYLTLHGKQSGFKAAVGDDIFAGKYDEYTFFKKIVA